MLHGILVFYIITIAKPYMQNLVRPKSLFPVPQ